MQITEDNQVLLQLKTKYSDGTTHLKFTYGEFIEKLVALVPPPRAHLVKWGGCFAPNSPYRKEITLRPEVKKGFQYSDDDDPNKLIKNNHWSLMLARTFKIDVTKCDRCSGEMRAVAAVTCPDGIKRYLRHLGLDSDPPSLASARARLESLDFDQSQYFEDEFPIIDCG